MIFKCKFFKCKIYFKLNFKHTMVKSKKKTTKTNEEPLSKLDAILKAKKRLWHSFNNIGVHYQIKILREMEKIEMNENNKEFKSSLDNIIPYYEIKHEINNLHLKMSNYHQEIRKNNLRITMLHQQNDDIYSEISKLEKLLEKQTKIIGCQSPSFEFSDEDEDEDEDLV